MNDLTNLPPASNESRPTWNALSERLRGLLAAGDFHAVSRSPALVAEAQNAVSHLRQDATWGASAAEVMAVLAPRFALYPQPDRTDGEWQAWWSEYVNALDDIPPCAIEAAMAEYVKGADSEFFPKPGKIRELAKTVPNRMSRAVDTAQRAIRHADFAESARSLTDKPAEPPTPKESVREMLAGFNRAMAERKPAPKPQRPPVSGPIDERGLTAAMRDHLARMRAE